ncbi:hypothetical protein B0I35DRAFT_432190 [Stachybotrys elegans]|uniref:Uncharacterized protein n=1 Tax=Stachybotrys elegans TaxID=80388 RepID=A0A8K0SWH9_9HYPO|nr:hypothetical protein B0I35DRAFT_432190 [Stachybotrys elegans]
MGIHGPLTAQALGRSPYDDVVQGEGEADPRQPAQQYDHRGRPFNPETKRMNRDIIRAHNEVMLVIGVAEPENPQATADAELRRLHWNYETSIGLKLDYCSRRCIEAVGFLGLHGLRQRILIYKHYSETPFWTLFKQARADFSIFRDMLPGAVGSFLTSVVEDYVSRLWRFRKDRVVARQIIHEVWSYMRVHLELFVALQRVGLIPATQWLPKPSFFIPFSYDSPIPCPPVVENLNPSLSLLRLAADVLISATPFLVWVVSQRLTRHVRQTLWTQVYYRLAKIGSPGMSSLPLPAMAFPNTGLPPVPLALGEAHHEADDMVQVVDDTQEELPAEPDSLPGPFEAVRRQSIFSVRGGGDDYASEEEEHEGLSAALITFDVEEATDAPAGLWSAELRPTQGDGRSGSAQPLYFHTLLRQLPVRLAGRIFTDAILRVLIAPIEATALRLAARMYQSRDGLITPAIYTVGPLRGLSWTAAVNFVGVEFLHLSILSDVWAFCACAAQLFLMSTDEFKSYQGEAGGSA